MAHKLSTEIKFDRISKEMFNEFLDTIVARNVSTSSGGEYKDESRDGFLDLYNYWNERGVRKMREKIKSNNAYLK